MSGANNTPLGRLNPAIGSGKKGAGLSLLKPSYMGSSGGGSSGSSSSSSSMKREADYSSSNGSDAKAAAAAAAERKRRRKSRWQGSEKEKTFIPGMPTVLPSNMSKDQEEAYLLQLQIEELSRRLRSNDLGIPPNPEDRLALHPFVRRWGVLWAQHLKLFWKMGGSDMKGRCLPFTAGLFLHWPTQLYLFTCF